MVKLTADLLLPPHLIVQVVKLLEEVVDLAALVVSLGGGEHTHLGLRGEVLADAGDRKHYLLHGAVMSHNLAAKRPRKISLLVFNIFPEDTEQLLIC